MVLIALKAFSWAHRGVEVEHFDAGQLIDTEDPDLIRVSCEEGWAALERAGGEQPTSDESSQEKAEGQSKTPRKRATK